VTLVQSIPDILKTQIGRKLMLILNNFNLSLKEYFTDLKNDIGNFEKKTLFKHIKTTTKAVGSTLQQLPTTITTAVQQLPTTLSTVVQQVPQFIEKVTEKIRYKLQINQNELQRSITYLRLNQNKKNVIINLMNNFLLYLQLNKVKNEKAKFDKLKLLSQYSIIKIEEYKQEKEIKTKYIEKIINLITNSQNTNKITKERNSLHLSIDSISNYINNDLLSHKNQIDEIKQNIFTNFDLNNSNNTKIRKGLDVLNYLIMKPYLDREFEFIMKENKLCIKDKAFVDEWDQYSTFITQHFDNFKYFSQNQSNSNSNKTSFPFYKINSFIKYFLSRTRSIVTKEPQFKIIMKMIPNESENKNILHIFMKTKRKGTSEPEKIISVFDLYNLILSLETQYKISITKLNAPHVVERLQQSQEIVNRLHIQKPDLTYSIFYNQIYQSLPIPSEPSQYIVFNNLYPLLKNFENFMIQIVDKSNVKFKKNFPNNNTIEKLWRNSINSLSKPLLDFIKLKTEQNYYFIKTFN